MPDLPQRDHVVRDTLRTLTRLLHAEMIPPTRQTANGCVPTNVAERTAKLRMGSARVTTSGCSLRNFHVRVETSKWPHHRLTSHLGS